MEPHGEHLPMTRVKSAIRVNIQVNIQVNIHQGPYPNYIGRRILR